MTLRIPLTKYLSALVLVLASHALVSNAPAQPEPDAANKADTEADPVAAEPATQPFEDYEASEQISEDLSVAFPVDI